MGSEQLTPLEIVEKYKGDVEKLLPYLSYFEKMAGKATATTFNQEGLSEHSLVFPVYDSNLLQFVKAAEATAFMNPNYHYIYSRNHIKSAEDELKLIENCSIQNIDIIGGILSKYIFSGRVKGAVWSQGVKNGVYLKLLLKLQEIIHFWENSK